MRADTGIRPYGATVRPRRSCPKKRREQAPALRRCVKKMCRWHIFSNRPQRLCREEGSRWFAPVGTSIARPRVGKPEPYDNMYSPRRDEPTCPPANCESPSHGYKWIQKNGSPIGLPFETVEKPMLRRKEIEQRGIIKGAKAPLND